MKRMEPPAPMSFEWKYKVMLEKIWELLIPFVISESPLVSQVVTSSRKLVAP
jgi:hypothetical protein